MRVGCSRRPCPALTSPSQTRSVFDLSLGRNRGLALGAGGGFCRLGVCAKNICQSVYSPVHSTATMAVRDFVFFLDIGNRWSGSQRSPQSSPNVTWHATHTSTRVMLRMRYLGGGAGPSPEQLRLDRAMRKSALFKNSSSMGAKFKTKGTWALPSSSFKCGVGGIIFAF